LAAADPYVTEATYLRVVKSFLVMVCSALFLLKEHSISTRHSSAEQ